MSLRNVRKYRLWQNADDMNLLLLDDVKNLRHLVTALPYSSVDLTKDYLAIHDKSAGNAKQLSLADLLALIISTGGGCLNCLGQTWGGRLGFAYFGGGFTGTEVGQFVAAINSYISKL